MCSWINQEKVLVMAQGGNRKYNLFSLNYLHNYVAFLSQPGNITPSHWVFIQIANTSISYGLFSKLHKFFTALQIYCSFFSQQKTWFIYLNDSEHKTLHGPQDQLLDSSLSRHALEPHHWTNGNQKKRVRVTATMSPCIYNMTQGQIVYWIKKGHRFRLLTLEIFTTFVACSLLQGYANKVL